VNVRLGAAAATDVPMSVSATAIEPAPSKGQIAAVPVELVKLSFGAFG
jgi:hypothetical protein